MKRGIKLFFYALIFIYITCALLELVLSLYHVFSDNLGNKFLMEKIQAENQQGIVKSTIWRQTGYCVFSITKGIGYLFILYFITKLNVMKDFNAQQCEETKEKNYYGVPGGDTNTKKELTEYEREKMNPVGYTTKLIDKLGTEGNILLFVTYIFFLFENLTDLSSLYIIGYVAIAPFFFLKFNLLCYKWLKYVKCILYPLYLVLMIHIVQYLLPGTLIERKGADVVNNDVLPAEINNYLKQGGYKVKVLHVDSDEGLNVIVSGRLKNLTIILGGNFNVFTDEEKIAVLYHEIGHIKNDSLVTRPWVMIFGSVILIVIEMFMLKLSRSLVSYRISKVGSWFLVFVVLKMTISPLITALINIYYQFDEFRADTFSIMHTNKIHLGTALVRLNIVNCTYLNFSKMFGYYFSSHPSLIARLENIGLV